MIFRPLYCYFGTSGWQLLVLSVSSTNWNLLCGDKRYLFSVGARDFYERALEFFAEENADEKLFLAFAKFEENCKEVWMETFCFTCSQN